MKTFIASEDDSLKNFTDTHYAQASFCFASLLREKNIRVNGARVSQNVPLKKGDEVRYFLSEKQQSRKAFEILYEDENLFVLDKESGVSSEAVFCALEGFPVHRLDRNTAGVMLLAKNPKAQEDLLAAFRGKKVVKEYLALVLGKMQKPHDVLQAYLKKDEKSAKVCVSLDKAGEKIVTEYEVIEERGETSLLKITLHTGKTHQIRAHLAFAGHPVVGDEKYGDFAYNRTVHRTRQMLVSKAVTVNTDGILKYLCDRTFVSKHDL